MPQLSLKIAQVTDELFDSAERRVLLELSRNIIDLRWSYRPGEGGMWSGEARFRVARNTRAWRQIKRGRLGAAFIYWEPEADRTMTGFDANEASRLLWFGGIENPELDPETEICTAELKGAGEFLSEVIVDLSDDGDSNHGGKQTVSALAENVADQAIAFDSRFDLFQSHYIAAVGACARKYRIDEESPAASSALKKLAAMIGGPTVIAWGVRAGGGADDMGEIYFQPWASSLWERSAGFLTPSWHIGPRQRRSLTIGRKTRDVRNFIVVHGEKDGWPVFRNEAQSGPSISRYGVRKERVTDDTAETLGELALVASAHLEEKATPRMDLSIQIAEPLDRGNQGGHADGEEAGLLQTALAQGGRPITVMLENLTVPAAVGESYAIARLIQQSTVANVLAIDTSDPGLTVGLWHPNADIATFSHTGTLGAHLHVIQGRWTGANPNGVTLLWELDRKIAVGLNHMGGDNYQVVASQRQAAGWTTLGLGGVNIPWTLGAAGTNLDELHSWGIELRALGTTYQLTVGRVDSNGTFTTVGTFGITPGLDGGVGTDDLILINGGLGTGGGAVTTNNLCRSFDCQSYDVYASLSGTSYNGLTWSQLLAEIANLGGPFKHSRDRILHCAFGLTEAGSGIGGSTAAWVRFGYPEHAPSGQENEHYGGFECSLLSTHANAGYLEDTAYSASSNGWLLGGGSHKRYLGAGLEILPREVEVRYQGPHNPLLIDIRGDAIASRITGAIERVQEDLEEMRRSDVV